MFGKKENGENIGQKTLHILKENFPQLPISRADFSAVYRLAAENCVICTFADKNLTNEIYEGRFGLKDRNVEFKKGLYVCESLTKNKMQVFHRLLAKIWSVYTRSDIPMFKLRRVPG